MNLSLAITTSTTVSSTSEWQQSLYMIGMLVLFFVVFYLFLIRPQKKKEKELNKQLEALRVGDKVVTIGGLVGYVANINDTEVTISTSVANTLVTFQKSAIGSVQSKDSDDTKTK